MEYNDMKTKQIYLYILLIFFLILAAAPGAFSKKVKSNNIGEVIQLYGHVERSSLATGKRFDIEIGSIIKKAQKIKTGKDSITEVLLNDGTSVLIKEWSSVNIIDIRGKKEDPPTKIKIDYGKVTILPKKTYDDRTLVLTTPTAIISNVIAKFSVIASENETRILVFSNKIGVASSNPALRKAYVIVGKQEGYIRKDKEPEKPVFLPGSVIRDWFEYYEIVNKHRYIIKKYREEGIVDWVLRKREY
ncbi:MAG: FecR domain-containing protein [bacterium]|nr:FecR domain-containing protein [bacterium]